MPRGFGWIHFMKKWREKKKVLFFLFLFLFLLRSRGGKCVKDQGNDGGIKVREVFLSRSCFFLRGSRNC
jgi:hypothetical protein